ncbi:MAG: class I SAM-dependent methyltransferase [Nitrospinae bacterium]|nr:class I SAM-dependent methyltransferase [Nitrospinota bacterium]
MEEKTSREYWDTVWKNRPIPLPLDPTTKGLNGYINRKFHDYFSRVLNKTNIKPGASLVEVGCGGSSILPYFTKVFGLKTEGMDNSKSGCILSRAIAQKSGIHSEIHEVDVLNLPKKLQNNYEFVYSNGFVEHFTPTEKIVKVLASLAKPGGYILTIIPNMKGVVGFLQKILNPPIYHIHVPLDVLQLTEAHEQSGLEVVESHYFLTANFGVLNFDGDRTRIPESLGRRLTSWTSKSIWILEGAGLPNFPNSWTSPYIICLARKP